VNNVVELLKMAVFYESKVIAAVLRQFIVHSLEDEQTRAKTACYYSKRFIELELVDDAITLAPLLADVLVG
jgi:hypothetical protein